MATTVSRDSRTEDEPQRRSQEAQLLTSLDLFAGAGGLSAGLRRGSAGFRPVRAVESDTEAAATYTQNFGEIVYVGKIENWLEEEVVPHVDIVVGGPPCQGFSMLGKRDANDVRNHLWQHYLKTIELAKPKAFVLENVPAFLKSTQFANFSQSFESGQPLSDYRFLAQVLNAADYDVAQVRKRVLVVGVHKDFPHPGFPQPEILREPRTVRDALRGIIPFAGERDLPRRQIHFQGQKLGGVFQSSELHLSRDYSSLSLSRFRAIPYGGGRFDLPEELEADCWKKHRTGSGDVMGRLVWERPSVTIRTEFHKPEKGRYLHPTEHRAITHFEAARIQGFPDDYKFVGSKVAIARQIGNAVPIQLGAAIGRHLATAIR